jgi:hypothetical protein
LLLNVPRVPQCSTRIGARGTLLACIPTGLNDNVPDVPVLFG